MGRVVMHGQPYTRESVLVLLAGLLLAALTAAAYAVGVRAGRRRAMLPRGDEPMSAAPTAPATVAPLRRAPVPLSWQLPHPVRERRLAPVGTRSSGRPRIP